MKNKKKIALFILGALLVLFCFTIIIGIINAGLFFKPKVV